jgi:hypothetical protein
MGDHRPLGLALLPLELALFPLQVALSAVELALLLQETKSNKLAAQQAIMFRFNMEMILEISLQESFACCRLSLGTFSGWRSRPC